MPVRYTCRFAVSRAPGGKLRVRYAYLGEDGVKPLILRGPAVVMPPPSDMTLQEFDRWRSAHGSPPAAFINGAWDGDDADDAVIAAYAGRLGMTPEEVEDRRQSLRQDWNAFADMPLIEAKKTVEDEIPAGAVSFELHAVTNDDGQTSVAVLLESAWHLRIPNVSASFDCRHEADQPVDPGVALENMNTLGRIGLVVDPDNARHLLPGKHCALAFVLPTGLAAAKSVAASLPLDRYAISVKTDGYEFLRVPGADVGAFLDRME